MSALARGAFTGAIMPAVECAIKHPLRRDRTPRAGDPVRGQRKYVPVACDSAIHGADAPGQDLRPGACSMEREASLRTTPREGRAAGAPTYSAVRAQSAGSTVTRTRSLLPGS